jgi:hypothetical protein
VSASLPRLKVYGPNNESFQLEITKDRVTIGRFAEFSDFGLEPDPQQLVTRKAHCVLEHEADTWWVIDNGSVRLVPRCMVPPVPHASPMDRETSVPSPNCGALPTSSRTTPG